MAEDSVLNNIKSEFKLWGVKFQHRITNGGHIELAWQVSPDKEVRKTYLPHTGSDWRGWLNQRAHVRDLFRQDGLIDPKKRPPEPVLKKALSLPQQQPERREDQTTAMRCEIAELTNYVLELGTIVSALCETIKQQRSVAQITAPEAPVPIPAFPPQEPALALPLKTRATNTRSKKVMDYLSVNWNSLDAIARDMDLDPIIVKRKLVYLWKNDKVELSEGRWRKVQPKAPPVMRGKKSKPIIHLNGNGKHRGRPRTRLNA